MNFFEEVVSWSKGSRKAQAAFFGILFTLFYKSAGMLGLPAELAIEPWQVVLVDGLLGLFILARMGHDMALVRANGKH